MKTKSTRKRLLVSSVAMLLVAMLALGTATYAWFTTSTKATANNLSVKTTKSSTLLLGKDNASTDGTTTGWSDSLDYGYNNDNRFVLKPASSANGVDWFKAEAAASNSSTAKAGSAEILGNLNGYVFKNQLNIWNHGDNAVNGVTIKFTLGETPTTTGKKYLRLALVEASGIGTSATLIGSFTAKNENNEGGIFAVGSDTAPAYKYTSATDHTITTQTVATADASSQVTINVGNMTANAKKSYNLYVWFEGQDADCCDNYSGNVMPSITFTVEGNSQN